MKFITTGTEDFKEFIDKNYYYVDKSDFIETVFQDKVTLFTRPRRFGKTLNMSMLYYFLSNKEKEQAYLFEGLKITQNTEIIKHQNQYPVIFLTFKDMKKRNFAQQVDYFASIIAREVRKHEELFDSPCLLASEKEILARYDYKTAGQNEIEDSLLNLSIYLQKHYQKKVILLIDEYDVPLQSAYLSGYYDEMSNFMGNVFSSALKTNGALEKGVLTGCLRIAKESIFTGLNNFSVYSILDKGIPSAHFGFTQEEIEELLKYYRLEKYLDRVKEWYDGYLFGEQEIYNPWSVLKYVNRIVQDRSEYPESYWANTSGNDIVYNYIKNGNENMKHEFELLVMGKSLSKTIMPELTYREMDDIHNIYSFLLFTGYLKCKRQLSGRTYELVIPNKEVRGIYEQSFSGYFEDYVKDRKNEFVEALKNGETEKANEILNDILSNSISFYDNYETFYHGFIMGLLSGYRTLSNRESGDGRFDIAIIPSSIMKSYILIECKKADKLSTLVKESEKACMQIREKQYIEGIEKEGYLNVIGYGISFFEKSCWITRVER